MAILGLTTNREPSFPRIGVLRKGGEKSEKRPGADLKYFRFDTEDATAESDFAAAYGKEPTTINVYLAYPTPDENFQAWQEDYAAGGMVHRCDGVTMTMWQGPDGKYRSEPKACPYHTGEKKRTTKEPGCKAVGRLTVIIPELRRFAYVTVGTGSLNDIMELTDNLNAVYAMRGNLQGVPFILCRRPRFISTPKPDGGRARYEKWMLSLEVNPEWATLQLAAMQKQAYLPTGARMLTDGRTVDTLTGEIDDFDADNGHVIDVNLADLEPLEFDATLSAIDEFLAIPSPKTGQTAKEHTESQAAQVQSTKRPDWNNPIDAKAWAEKVGACANEHEAASSLRKIIDNQFGGRLLPSNMDAVLDAFYARQMEKLGKGKGAEATPL
jgi:hypothetical protein